MPGRKTGSFDPVFPGQYVISMNPPETAATRCKRWSAAMEMFERV